MTDVISQLQNEVNNLCSMFFNFAGTLQRDAPKASLSGEPIAIDSSFNIEEQCRTMATDLLAASKAIDDSISKLPEETCTDQERQSRIVELWKDHNELEEKLQFEVDDLESILTELQEVHHVLVQNKINKWTKTASSDDSEASENSDASLDENKSNTEHSNEGPDVDMGAMPVAPKI